MSWQITAKISRRKYRAAYRRELQDLAALLRTAKAVPFPGGKARAGQDTPAGQPTPSR